MQHISENIIDTLADALIERMVGVLSQSQQAIPRWLSLFEVVQRVLGHTDIKTTQIYARVIDDLMVKEMGKLLHPKILTGRA